jgi:hypothetical protein
MSFSVNQKRKRDKFSGKIDKHAVRKLRYIKRPDWPTWLRFVVAFIM